MFGSMQKGPYGHIKLDRSGRVLGYRNSAEHSFRFDGSMLDLLDINGNVTSRLKAAGDTLQFLPHSGRPHYLVPVLELGPPKGKTDLPPVFINTSPKSGTYFAGLALEQAGYVSMRLHVMSKFLDDNREVSDELVHYNPEDRRLRCPANLVASCLGKGEFVVGHVADPEEMKAIADAGCELINIVREPTAQIYSMYKFRKKLVRLTPRRKLWSEMEGINSFLGFLLDDNIEQMLRTSRAITSSTDFLRFEDLLEGKVSEAVRHPELRTAFAAGVKAARDKPTPTYIPETASERDQYLADPRVVAFLEALDVYSYSGKFWPGLAKLPNG